MAEWFVSKSIFKGAEGRGLDSPDLLEDSVRSNSYLNTYLYKCLRLWYYMRLLHAIVRALSRAHNRAPYYQSVRSSSSFLTFFMYIIFHAYHLVLRSRSCVGH